MTGNAKVIGEDFSFILPTKIEVQRNDALSDLPWYWASAPQQ
jgi:hypothetical protein